MFCNKCGKEQTETAKFCESCGASLENNNLQSNHPTNNTIPKCNSCGYIGQWKLAPILRPADYIVGVVLLLFGIVPGLIYVGTVALIRSNKDNREKICPKCNAKNLWTFIY